MINFSSFAIIIPIGEIKKLNIQNKILYTLILAIVFTSVFIKIPTYSKNYTTTINQKNKNEQYNDDNIKEKPTDLVHLKTADYSQNSNYNFSANIYLEEEWNQWFGYLNYNSTKPNDFTNWIMAPNTRGFTLEFVLLVINLNDSSTGQPLLPSDLTTMKLSYYNESQEREEIGIINDFVPAINQFGINGTITGMVNSNETTDAQFVIWNDWLENINVSYNIFMNIQANKSRTLEANFFPTKENTQSDSILWEINYHTLIHNEYNATLDLSELDNFTVKNVLALDGAYWKPIIYEQDETYLYIINKTYSDFRIELETPNYISVVYNDNLTQTKNELRLYATSKMAGNLTIKFLDTNGNFTEVNYTVTKDQTVFFNYLMNGNSSGGIGYLNITLTNKTTNSFGVKIGEILFYKDAFVWGGTGNTTAFSQLWILAPFLDSYRWNDIISRNASQKLNLSIFEFINYSIIHDAAVTYEIAGIIGELEESIVPINETGEVYNVSLYFKIIDLREFLIKPGTYNLTITATKQGYTFTKFITEITIFKQEVYIDVQVTPPTKIFTIEESFAISLSLYVFTPYFENFLRVPVNISFEVLKDGVIDDQIPLPNVVQSISLQGIMGNDSIPGQYTLNISIISDYYKGNVSIDVEVKKKQLELSLIYDDEVDEDENFDIKWSLANGNFTGNRENMTLEIYLDNVFYTFVNLTSTNSSSGVLTLKLDEGDYTITYRLISPFYDAEKVISIESIKEESKPKEKSWLEENWLMILLLLVAIIAMSAFGVYMTISRRKVKAQRELDSELVALKTKLTATEANISLIETQISQIGGIYWILVIHSEQGTTMVEIDDFRFKDVLGVDFEEFIDKSIVKDSALIGGFLTAIRNFSQETSGTSLEYQPLFNSHTDYSTIVNDREVHRRILEGTSYFMAFISTRSTMEITDVLSIVNAKFRDGYGEAAKEFTGKITVFEPFKEEVVSYLHNEIRELQKKLEEQKLLLEHYERHLKQVQEKIGIKKNM